jgi:hypothetical protein
VTALGVRKTSVDVSVAVTLIGLSQMMLSSADKVSV